MKVVLQKVKTANVTVDEELVNSIDAGLCVFVGFSKKDTEADVDFIVRNLLDLQLFGDTTLKKSVRDTNNEILCVSQFSLYNRLKGNALDFHQAMQGEKAHVLYNIFLQKLRDAYVKEKIKDGRFGVCRSVFIQNDGPMLFTLESPSFQ